MGSGLVDLEVGIRFIVVGQVCPMQIFVDVLNCLIVDLWRAIPAVNVQKGVWALYQGMVGIAGMRMESADRRLDPSTGLSAVVPSPGGD